MSSSSDSSAGRREIEDSTAARLAEIVAAAEKAAKQVIDEAEAEARSRLSDAHEEADRIVAVRLAELASLTEEIEAQAEELRRGAEALQAALARVKAEFGDADSSGGPATSRPEAVPDDDGDRPTAPSLTVVGAPRTAPRPGPGPAADRVPADRAPSGDRELTADRTPSDEREFAPEADAEDFGTPSGARLLATQMAVSGSSREEIEARLRSGFAIADTTAILDAILGPER